MASHGAVVLAAVLAIVLVSSRGAHGQYVAELIGESEDSGNSYTASYTSAIFGDQVTVQVTPKAISFATYAPTTVIPGLSSNSVNVPMNETFPIPTNASVYTVVDHITVFYNPFGAFPYPSGLTNPLWSANISQSLSCVTCWFYISFFFIPSNESQLIAPACGTSPNFFCSGDLVQAGKSGDPSPGFLPPSFRAASGDFYDRSVVRSSVAGERLGNLKQIRNTVTPLIGAQLGQLWVSGKHPPYTFIYNGTRIVAAENYYVTDNAEVVGVGQVVSRDFFAFFSDFFANTQPTFHKIVNASGPFDVPAEFAEEGDYPGGAFTEVNGFKGTSTFTFGFTNTTYRLPPPPNAGSNLVLNLPWLIASVWIAGAVVLLSDHL